MPTLFIGSTARIPHGFPTLPDRRRHAHNRISTLLNAVIGGVAGIILSFVPLSTLLGGAIAVYLEGGTPGDEMKVGAIDGLVMLVPFVLFGLFFGTFFFGFGMGRPRMPIGIVAVFTLIVGALYTIGLSTVGGYLGIYLKHEL